MIRDDTLFVSISQSGETADTLAALRSAKDADYLSTLAICNVDESSLTRESDLVFLTHAGIEIGVASTKAFTSQVIVLSLITLFLKQKFDSVGGKYEVKFKITGEAFLTPPGRLSDLICDAIKKTTGLEPTLSTTGGTSDARFIKDFCPIAEFGLISQSMHKVDENVQISDIKQLTEIYRTLLNNYFPE